MEYDYEWLLENLITIRMVKKTIPIFWIDEDNDPKEITALKDRLYKIKNDLEDLEFDVYKMLKKSKSKVKSEKITSDEIKELRCKTGRGIMDCKRALDNCNGNFEKATEWLDHHGNFSLLKI